MVKARDQNFRNEPNSVVNQLTVIETETPLLAGETAAVVCPNSTMGDTSTKMKAGGFPWVTPTADGGPAVLDDFMEIAVEEAPDCPLLKEDRQVVNHVCVKMHNYCPQKGDPLFLAGANNDIYCLYGLFNGEVDEDCEHALFVYLPTYFEEIYDTFF